MGDHAPSGGQTLKSQGGEEPDTASIEAGRLLFAGDCRFIFGATKPDALPPANLPEVAFLGRSNVGKSSLINALTGRTALARTSQSPGHTRQLNFFELAGRIILVDMPGYGYAKAPKGEIAAWQRLIGTYFRGRAGLRRLFLLLDARHALKDSDREMMTALDIAAVAFQAVLTKVDKCPREELQHRLEELVAELAKHPAALPDVFSTSAAKKAGLDELRAAIATLALPGQFR